MSTFNNAIAISITAGGYDISRSYLSLNTIIYPITTISICIDVTPTVGSSIIVISSTGSHAKDLESSLHKLNITNVDLEG